MNNNQTRVGVSNEMGRMGEGLLGGVEHNAAVNVRTATGDDG